MRCPDSNGQDRIRLMDGGANDNQALIEVYLILSELALHQVRSDLSIRDPGKLERMKASDRVWCIVVNSSVTESTGQPDTTSDDPTRSASGLLLGVIDKVLSATDTYSAIGYDLRRQLYLLISDRLRSLPGTPFIVAVDISLTSLDQYYLGGTEAALRQKAQIGTEKSDISEKRIQVRALRQRRAYPLVEDKNARAVLALSDWHPQCHFDMRAQLDAPLNNISDNDQACLRKAARWSAALRAQELCNGVQGTTPPDSLDCYQPVVRFRDPQALAGEKLPGTCQPKVPDLSTQHDLHVTGRALD